MDERSSDSDLVHFAPVPFQGHPLKAVCNSVGLEPHTITTNISNATCPACLSKSGEEVQAASSSAVHHLDHYGGKGALEVIRVVEHYKLDFNLATAVCYLLRAGRKGPAAVDLKKAVWYLVREIAVEMDEDPSAWVELIPKEFK